MAVRSSVPKIKVYKPVAPRVEKVSIKGPGVPKLKAPGVAKIPTLPSLTVQARRGQAPKLALAKAAAGASANTSKRNSYYPTP